MRWNAQMYVEQSHNRYLVRTDVEGISSKVIMYFEVRSTFNSGWTYLVLRNT